MEIPIVFEDDYLLVVNKPAGWVVNRSITWHGNTIQDWVEKRYPHLFDNYEPGSDFARRSGFVHRLDKGTSGVLLLAKNEDVWHKLTQQFKRRLVKKEYLALVWGEVADPYFSIDAPLSRNPRFRMRMAVVEGGKPALTSFRRKQVYPDWQGTGLPATLLEVFPRTGRTHQIRVHLASLGYPVIGDKLYSGKSKYKISRQFIDQPFLHARRLSFIHPVSRKTLVVEAELPEQLDRLLR